MKLPQWALPVVPIVAAGIALAALTVNTTKSTDWAIPGYIGAALCIVLAIAGVRLVVVSTSERRTRLRRARLRALVCNGIHFLHLNDRL